MNNKNKTATIIASVIVGAAVVTGSVYAAVTATQHKEEAESTSYITEIETTTEAVTEPVNNTAEPGTVNNSAATETPSNANTSTNENEPASAGSVTQIPFKSQAELDAEYKEYLVWLSDRHDTAMKTYSPGPPPKEPSSDATDREVELYNERLKEYQERVARYDEYRQNEEIRYQQALKDAKIKYNQP